MNEFWELFAVVMLLLLMIAGALVACYAFDKITGLSAYLKRRAKT